GTSFLIHAHGAINTEVDSWNITPVSVDKQPSRVWDWNDLQFLRGLKIRQRSSLINLPIEHNVLAVAHLGETVQFRVGQTKPGMLVSGWSVPLAEGTWNVNDQPTIFVRVPELAKRMQPVRLIVLLRTNAPEKLPDGVQVIVNEEAVSRWKVDEQSRQM